MIWLAGSELHFGTPVTFLHCNIWIQVKRNDAAYYSLILYVLRVTQAFGDVPKTCNYLCINSLFGLTTYCTDSKQYRQSGRKIGFHISAVPTSSSLIATQLFDGNPWSIGTRNWRQPDQWPTKSIMQIRLNMRMNTLAMFRNWKRGNRCILIPPRATKFSKMAVFKQEKVFLEVQVVDVI